MDADNGGAFNVASLVKNRTVDKLKVDELKQIVKNLGLSVTGKKKSDLVEDVYANFVA